VLVRKAPLQTSNLSHICCPSRVVHPSPSLINITPLSAEFCSRGEIQRQASRNNPAGNPYNF
jgi:hypothetical protein